MLNVFMVVWKYKHYIGAMLAALSLLGALWGYGHVKYKQGLDKGTQQCEREKQEAINENIEIRKIQDSVGRADDSSIIDSLRRNTF